MSDKRVVAKLSPEAARMVEFAKRQIRGLKADGQWRRVTHTEAIDWLLRDLCEYGSSVVGAEARRCWPDSVESREWERKNHQPRNHQPRNFIID
jgi:hypothetical protein